MWWCQMWWWLRDGGLVTATAPPCGLGAVSYETPHVTDVARMGTSRWLVQGPYAGTARGRKRLDCILKGISSNRRVRLLGNLSQVVVAASHVALYRTVTGPHVGSCPRRSKGMFRGGQSRKTEVAVNQVVLAGGSCLGDRHGRLGMTLKPSQGHAVEIN